MISQNLYILKVESCVITQIMELLLYKNNNRNNNKLSQNSEPATVRPRNQQYFHSSRIFRYLYRVTTSDGFTASVHTIFKTFHPLIPLTVRTWLSSSHPLFSPQSRHNRSNSPQRLIKMSFLSDFNSSQ